MGLLLYSGSGPTHIRAENATLLALKGSCLCAECVFLENRNCENFSNPGTSASNSFIFS